MLPNNSWLTYRGLCLAVVVAAVILGILTPMRVCAGDVLFPSDTGMVNVKTAYGAVGDGIADDTAAIQQAINENSGNTKIKVLFFPKGTYRVTDTLQWKGWNADHTALVWKAFLSFQGENRDETIIKLDNSRTGFANASTPKAVLMTASEGSDKPDGSGGSGFRINIKDLTVDVGTGNAGAIGIDYLGNNQSTIENVTIRSGDGVGVAGISMWRNAPGPCLISKVKIEGFDYGIKVQYRIASVTIDDLTLIGQRIAGIYNLRNVLAIRHLRSINSVPAIMNVDAAGLIVLIDGYFTGGSSTVSAIVDTASNPATGNTYDGGGMYIRSVIAKGYQSVLKVEGTVISGDTVTEYTTRPALSLFDSPASSLMLPIRVAPTFHDNKMNNWVNVVAHGANPSDWNDDTVAVQTAIDYAAANNKTTVYLPSASGTYGRYVLSNTIHLHGSVRRLVGFMVDIFPTSTTPNLWSNAADPKAVFRVENDASAADNVGEPLFIEGIRWVKSQTQTPGAIVIEHASARTLVIRHSMLVSGDSRKYSFRNTANAGPVFIEDSVGSEWRFEYPQNIWARQLNLEGYINSESVRVRNNGANLWVLGYKTECVAPNGPYSMYETLGGGQTELLGGLLMGSPNIPTSLPAFINNNSSHSLVYATETPAESPTNTYPYYYPVQVRETRGTETLDLLRGAVPVRTYAGHSICPLYSGRVATAVPPTQLVHETFDAATNKGTITTDGSAAISLSTEQSAGPGPGNSYSLKFSDATDTQYPTRPNTYWNITSQSNNMLRVAFDVYKETDGDPKFYMLLKGGSDWRTQINYKDSTITASYKVGNNWYAMTIASNLVKQTWYRVTLDISTATTASNFTVTVTSPDGATLYGKRFDVPYYDSNPGAITQLTFIDDGSDTSVEYLDNVFVDVLSTILDKNFDDGQLGGTVTQSGSATIAASTEQSVSPGYSVKFSDATDAIHYHPHVLWNFPVQSGNVTRVRFDVRKQTTGNPSWFLNINDSLTTRATLIYSQNSMVLSYKVNGTYYAKTIAPSLADQTWYRVEIDIPTSTAATGFIATVTSSDGSTVYGRQIDLPFFDSNPGSINRVHFTDSGIDTSVEYMDNLFVGSLPSP